MDTISTKAPPPRLSFAKVAASANERLPKAPALNKVRSPTNNDDTTRTIQDERPPAGAETATNTKNVVLPFQRNSQSFENKPAPLDSTNSKAASTTNHSVAAAALATPRVQTLTLPVSEENITQLASAQEPRKPSSFDGKSTLSVGTYAMDEKESIRPDDSASVKASEEEDGRTSRQDSSRMSSDTGAHAFRDQLREIPGIASSQRAAAPMPHSGPALPSSSGRLYVPSPPPHGNPFSAAHAQNSGGGAPSDPFAPDPKLVEALFERDRFWVLKLEDSIVTFMRDAHAQFYEVQDLSNSFYRMLAHKLADYYLLAHTVIDSSGSVLRLTKTPVSRIPVLLSTLTNQPPTDSLLPAAPQMKILRRDDTRPNSRDGSGHNGDDSGSESGKAKAPKTREEREARYEAARKRIMGSAKPEDDPPLAKEKEDSRSSSAAGKKKNKKHRSDSEDGFEARSAYAHYAGSSFPAPGMQAPTQFYPAYTENGQYPYGLTSYSTGEPYQVHPGYSQPGNIDMSGYGQMSQGFPGYTDMYPQRWGGDQHQSAYDMPAHFNQSMSFQNINHAASPSSPAGPPNGSFSPTADFRGSQNVYPAYPGMGPSYGPPGGGRPSPFMPVYGAFNGPQFNPQSQAFIPGYQSSPGISGQQYGSGPVCGQQHLVPGTSPYPLQRQYSSHSQASSHSQPHSGPQDNPGFRASQAMTHPLPQPIFPAKTQSSSTSPASTGNSISKWERPPSLPAKPPPPANDLRFNRNTRDGSAAAGMQQRHPLPPMPSFNATYGGQNAYRPGYGGTMPSPGLGQANAWPQR